MADESLPLSFAQQRLWLIDQLERGSSAYNLPHALLLDGPLSIELLRQTLQAIVERHESLRTTVATVEGQPVQVVHPAQPVDLPAASVEGIPESRRMEEAFAIAAEQAGYPFDLSTGPLFRLKLIRVSEQKHLLIVIAHHIISDGWSQGIMLREIGELYGALSQGHQATLPALEVQYGDYAKWQREWVTSDMLRDHMDFWKRILRHAPPVLSLPADRPRPANQSHRGRTLTFRIDPGMTAELRALSRAQGVTLFVLLVAALKTLLFRYTGSEDILVGTPVAGRNRVEIERLVGFFVNTVVVRTDLSENPSFSELLQRVKRASLEAFDHSDLPFDKLVQELQVDRSFSHSPVFQVMFVLESRSRETRAGALAIREVDFDPGVSKFDLTLNVFEDNGLSVIFEYNSDIFDRSRIERMAGHFQVLLGGILRNPEARLADLPLLTPEERRRVLVDWNETEAAYPSGICIHEFFETQADRTPSAVALIGDDRQVTYQQADEEANRLANHLASRGARPGDRVGVCLERSVDAMVALLAVMKAGCAYVPMDPAYPTQRIAFMLADSKAPLLITQHGLRSRLPDYTGIVVQYDRDHEAIRSQPASRPRVPADSRQPAYVIYTSGSTGVPKGVIGSHRAALNRFSWMWRTYPFAPGEVACQKTSLSFVDSIWEIFGALLQGVPTYVVPDQAVRDPEIMIRALAAHRVSRIVVVPSFLRTILENCQDLSARAPNLRFWVSSGEHLPFDLYQQFRSKVPDARLVNIYGSSEVTADVTWFDTAQNEPRNFVPIGRPISNTRTYILDPYRNPVPIGVPGELYIGGDCLALGYLDRPDLTGERFIPDSFKESGGRLFKTGDLARYGEDGNIEYLGRADNQVKIRGIRVELGEIEAALNAHESVRQALVTLDPAGEPRLVAYCVPQPGAAVDVSQIRRFVRSKLPEHMVPSAFLFLEALPLTPNGKVDRRNLPQAAGAPERMREYVAPRNEAEQKLAEIWSEVLKLDPIGITDQFFDLGGHSLSAVQVIARVRREFGVEISMRALFEEPTIAGLAAAIGIARAAGTVVQVPQITRRRDARRSQLLAQLNEMSEEDVEALLQSALEKRSQPAKA